MPAKVTLTVTQGSLSGQQFVFEERTTGIIGRSRDCYPQIPDDENHRTISRYHCLLDINPPDIRVRDFGSKNGTCVNGQKIGQRQPNQTPEEGAKLNFPEYDLQEGDEIKLGNTVFRVSVERERELDPAQKIPVAQAAETPQPPNRVNLFDWLKRLLHRANAGEENLLAIRGYTVLKLLGKGGFGAVYLARHNQTGNEVALKVMLPEVAGNQWAVEKFLREVENTKALRHPNVVKLLDYGYSDGTFFLTMEYCAGGTVADLMQRRGGKLPADEAILIILQVLDGLTYAHSAEIPCVKRADGSLGKGKGLVHRDLKPANILLDSAGNNPTAKIGDYGLAKAFDLAGLSGQTLTGTKAGTPSFMPRQQVIDFKYAKPEVDIWTAAACLYTMLTGKFPRNVAGVDPFLAILSTNAIPIRNRDASIPQPLAEVIDLALVDNPEIHFKNAADFKQALESAGKKPGFF
jgi:pSer/pThr/pTyr-binding forkhead associated (FHA) protein